MVLARGTDTASRLQQDALIFASRMISKSGFGDKSGRIRNLFPLPELITHHTEGEMEQSVEDANVTLSAALDKPVSVSRR